jgi:hypothetical protein
MVIKIWSIKNPLLGGVLLASTFSQVARAAELPASQPLPTPGIPTPDQAVRYMATNVVSASRSAAALSSSAKPIVTGVSANSLVSSRPISPLPIASPGLPNPSQVLSSCPANVCGLIATQPPVVLGTALPSGISKNEQSKFENFTNTISTPLKTDAVAPQTITPNDQVTSTAKVSLSIEPGLSKDIAFGQPAIKSARAEKTASKIAEQPTITPTIANITAPDKAIGIGNVQNQITSFTGQLVASSWKLITVLPKPQLDASLLNIGSSPFQPYDSLSFSPRLTLGNAAEPLFKTNKSSSLSTSPLFTTLGPVLKTSPVASQWNQSSFLVKPLNTDGFKLNKFSPYNGFSNINRFEASTKPFNIMTFLATVNTSTLSSNKLSNSNY